jgi:hypothetical protein
MTDYIGLHRYPEGESHPEDPSTLAVRYRGIHALGSDQAPQGREDLRAQE